MKQKPVSIGVDIGGTHITCAAVRMADDYFSTRWFLNNYQKQSGKEIAGVKYLAEKAKTDTFAKILFTQFGQNLAECLGPWLRQFEAEMLIIGGNIAHTLPLFEPSFQEGLKKTGVAIQIATSHLMENAALIGSARLMDDVFWEKVSVELPHI